MLFKEAVTRGPNGYTQLRPTEMMGQAARMRVVAGRRARKTSARQGQKEGLTQALPSEPVTTDPREVLRSQGAERDKICASSLTCL